MGRADQTRMNATRCYLEGRFDGLPEGKGEGNTEGMLHAPKERKADPKKDTRIYQTKKKRGGNALKTEVYLLGREG